MKAVGSNAALRVDLTGHPESSKGPRRKESPYIGKTADIHFEQPAY